MKNNTDTWTLKLRPFAFDLPRDEVEEEVDRMFEVGEFYLEEKNNEND